MKKILLAIAAISTFVACKNEKKTDTVVGKNEAGQELVVNETGDTIAKITSTDSVTTPAAVTVEKPLAVYKATDDQYAFKYNLEKGKTYPLTMAIQSTHTASDGKETMKMSNSSKKSIEYTVKDVQNGIYTLEVNSKHYSEKMTGPDGKSISYDTNSAKPTDKSIAVSWSIYKAMIGKSYTMKIDQKGKVIAVEGLEPIRKTIENSVKQQLNAEEQKMLGEVIKNSLSKDVLAAQFEETMNIYPNKNLKLKESWSDSQNINEGPMKGNITMTRTLSSVEPTKTTITVKGVQKVSGSESQQEVKMSANANADVNGSIILDTESGWINKVSLTKKETLKRTVEGQGQKQTMTETVTTTTNVN